MLIIFNAKNEMARGYRKKNNGSYYELHHILPKSLFPRWSSHSIHNRNCVLLSAREHFFCHQLLTKIYPTAAMNYALHAFISRPNADYRISSKEYERIKKNYAIITSNRFKGRKRPREEVEKIIATKRLKNIRPTEETKRKISESSKKRRWTEDQRQKILSTKRLHGRSKKQIESEQKWHDGYKKYISENREKQRILAYNASKIAAIKNMKKVICIETGEIFNSVNDALKVINSDGGRRNLSNAIKKHIKCGQYHYEFLNE